MPAPLSQELGKTWPDITNYRSTMNWCDRTIHRVCGISTKFMPARQLHNIARKAWKWSGTKTHDFNSNIILLQQIQQACTKTIHLLTNSKPAVAFEFPLMQACHICHTFCLSILNVDIILCKSFCTHALYNVEGGTHSKVLLKIFVLSL